MPLQTYYQSEQNNLKKVWDQEGQKRYTTEIHVANMTFLSTKKETGVPASDNNGNPSSTAQQSQPKADDDDLPF